MAHITADRVRDTSTSTGTGNFLVSGSAPIGSRNFSSVLTNGDTFYYAIVSQTLNEWEVGLGTWTSTANTFSRTTVYSSSTGSAVNFSGSSTKDVFLTLAADRSVQLNPTGGIPIKGSTSGSVTLAVPATAGSNTLTLPAATGNVITSADSGTVTPTMLSQKLTLGTSVASTSGTSIDFTSIPSWVKRITVMFNAVSLSGTADYLVQVGSGSVSTSGYTSYAAYAGGSSSSGAATSTAGYLVFGGANTSLVTGHVVITLLTGTTYLASHVIGYANGTSYYGYFGGGTSPSLSGALDSVRITTTNGTDTFDAGSINILYEG